MPSKMSNLYTEILNFNQINFNRDELIDNYAHTIIEGMDLDTLVQFAYDMMVENLNELSNEKLLEEVNTFNPELLEDVSTL